MQNADDLLKFLRSLQVSFSKLQIKHLRLFLRFNEYEDPFDGDDQDIIFLRD